MQFENVSNYFSAFSFHSCTSYFLGIITLISPSLQISILLFSVTSCDGAPITLLFLQIVMFSYCCFLCVFSAVTFQLFNGWSACPVPTSQVLICVLSTLNPFKPFIAGVWKCWWESGRSQIFFTSCWLCFLALGWQPSLRLHRHPPACKPVPCCWLSRQQTCSHWTSVEDIHNRHPRFRSWYISTLLPRLKDYAEVCLSWESTTSKKLWIPLSLNLIMQLILINLLHILPQL